MNKKSISGIIAVILMIAAVAYAGFTNNTDKPVETQNTASQSYIEGETYTYNVPGETDFTSGETYSFRYESYLDEHFEKHKADTHTSSKSEYLYRANYVINNEKSLHKTEKEDGDDVYYLASTNELVIVSTDGYIRTYFCPDSGKEYYDKQ